MNDDIMVCLRYILLAVCLFTLNCSLFEANQNALGNARTRATDEAISRSPELQKLNAVCMSVPLPSGFKFLSKGGIDDQKLSLAYRYSSDKPWVEVSDVFYQHFLSLKWKVDDLSDRYPQQIDFSDGNYRVAISMQRDGQIKYYTIYCEKL